MISEFAKEKVFWTKKMNLKLVKFIESRPNIWNPKHSLYTSTESRDQTYSEFASKYGNDFTGQAVKDRWTNIRSTFANYLRKRTASRARADGEEYKVNWHLWEPCQFLIKVNRKLKSDPSATEELEEEEEVNDKTVSQAPDQSCSTDDENYSALNTNDYSCNAIANNLVELFKDMQNDAFGADNSKNGRVGRTVAQQLTNMNTYDAARASQKIMEILLLYDSNNPENPNHLNIDGIN